MKIITSFRIFTILLIIFCGNISAQNHPGGVVGSDVWYIADWSEFTSNNFPNISGPIIISNCGETLDMSLFNFNHSTFGEELCLLYRTHLENSNGRNVFFVGSPIDNKNYSHLASQWRNDISQDSINRNELNLNNKNLSSYLIYNEYLSDKDSHINFYHSSHYNIDRKFRSFGMEGETDMLIGKLTNQSMEGNSFVGNFPEFISYPRELSDNERQRIDSYLAIKYGITLNPKEKSYLSSQNLVVWSRDNVDKFPSRIFGLGKDAVSLLNQLQSESVHFPNHLIASFGEIVETNHELQDKINIEDQSFLIFSDNNDKLQLNNQNTKKVTILHKIWLAQRTGRLIPDYPVKFLFYLPDDIYDYLIANPKETLWLIQDEYVTNDTYSDFDNENLNYYPAIVDLNEQTGIVANVLFDTNNNIYDQFTFGVGPKMIILAHLFGCEGDKPELTIEIIGGTPDFEIKIESSEGSEQIFIPDHEYTFNIDYGVNYDISVFDSYGNEAYLEYTATPWIFNLDLGPDQILTPNNPEVFLDASTNINDSNATYEWYKEGILLPQTDANITITEPGHYAVIVTSQDLSCSVEDEIIITRPELIAHFEILEACDEHHNSIKIEILEGLPPFTINFQGTQNLNYLTYDNELLINDIPFGLYQTLILDSEGNSISQNITLEPNTSDIGLNVISQIFDICEDYPQHQNCFTVQEAVYFSPPDELNSFYLDASEGVTGNNLYYQWFISSTLLNYNEPILHFENSNDCYYPDGGKTPITVKVTDLSTNCSQEQTFYLNASFCPILDYINTSKDIENTDEDDEMADIKTTDKINTNPFLNTVLYPNPAEANTMFTYEVEASEDFYGVIEIFTMNGAKINRTTVNGSSQYSVSLSVPQTGTYIIRITTSIGIIESDRVIIK